MQWKCHFLWTLCSSKRQSFCVLCSSCYPRLHNPKIQFPVVLHALEGFLMVSDLVYHCHLCTLHSIGTSLSVPFCRICYWKAREIGSDYDRYSHLGTEDNQSSSVSTSLVASAHWWEACKLQDPWTSEKTPNVHI